MTIAGAGAPDANSDEGASEGLFSGGLPDMQGLLQQASAMQARLLATQHELAGARIEGTSGGGLVHATVTGTGDLIGLRIDPEVCDPDDPDTLADLILAAVHNATDNAHRHAADAMGAATGDLGAGLGAGLGADLGSLFGGDAGGDGVSTPTLDDEA